MVCPRLPPPSSTTGAFGYLINPHYNNSSGPLFIPDFSRRRALFHDDVHFVFASLRSSCSVGRRRALFLPTTCAFVFASLRSSCSFACCSDDVQLCASRLFKKPYGRASPHRGISRNKNVEDMPKVVQHVPPPKAQHTSPDLCAGGHGGGDPKA